jgi:hypothetical protein
MPVTAGVFVAPNIVQPIGMHGRYTEQAHKGQRAKTMQPIAFFECIAIAGNINIKKLI